MHIAYDLRHRGTIPRQCWISNLRLILVIISRLRCERQIIVPISKKRMVSFGSIHFTNEN